MRSFVSFGQSTRGRMTSPLRTSPGMKPVPSASVMAGAYPRRRNGNMPPGPGRTPAGRSVMTSASLESTPGIVTMLRTSLNPLAVSRPIPGGSLTCMAMSGSGCRIAGMTTMTKHQPMAAPGKQTNVHAGWCAAGRSSTRPCACAPRAGSRPPRVQERVLRVPVCARPPPALSL